MINVYLFDWGDTLMVDFPNVDGKMCDWEVVEAVAGAKEALAALSKNAEIYIATGAADSTELEIKRAFDRVNLGQYISGYFCKANLGVAKGSAEFLTTILDKLKISAKHVAMVGDNFDKDITPALVVGIQPFWFVGNIEHNIKSVVDNIDAPSHVKIIKRLSDLYS